MLDPETLIEAAWGSLDPETRQATDYESFRLGFLKALLAQRLLKE